MNQYDMPLQERKNGISGSTLKIIAIVSMLIDHIGAVIVLRMLMHDFNNELYTLYNVLRGIGRIGFPIFCFLLVEGFRHTRNSKKYAVRLGIFALISEIPFDLAFRGKLVDLSYQNVFFTLLIGLLVMIVCRKISEKFHENRIVMYILYVPTVLFGVMLAEFLQTDYAGIGILCIMALYFFRGNKACQMVAGCTAFLWELPAPVAFIPVVFYNGKRGFRIKYFFYAFYPVHLFLLYLAARFAGLL